MQHKKTDKTKSLQQQQSRKPLQSGGDRKKIEERYLPLAPLVDRTDGLSMEFPQWRFNLRWSITEPVLRLNVESRGDEAPMREMTSGLLQLIDTFALLNAETLRRKEEAKLGSIRNTPQPVALKDAGVTQKRARRFRVIARRLARDCGFT